MRILIAMVFALWPLSAVAGGLYGIELKDDDTTTTTDVYIEDQSLKMGIAAASGGPNTDEVMIRRERGGVTVILVDHRGRVYSKGRIEGVGPSIGLLPTGRMEMAPGGIKLHVGGGPSDLWIQVKRTGEVGEMLQWVNLLQEVSLKLGDEFPDPFDDGFLDDELTLRESRRRTLDPADFEPPSGYKRRTMLFSGSGSGSGSGTTTGTAGGAAATGNASGAAVSSTMSATTASEDASN